MPISPFVMPQPPPHPVIVLLYVLTLYWFIKICIQAHSICPSSPHAPTPYPDILSASSTPLSSPASSPRLLVEDISPVPLTNNNLIPRHTVTKIKIKRPKGAGWKNLMELVNWKVDLLDAVKAHAKIVILQYLNPSLSFNKQNKAKIKLFQTEVMFGSAMIAFQC
ncbi:hypothetical protein L208DRAFT_1377084 [Tricholoma matsutake]|nr:hypothetical protein L208DRAFT_1377084 [Tricholoma matsutake 945]